MSHERCVNIVCHINKKTLYLLSTYPRGTTPFLKWVPSTYPVQLNLLKRFSDFENTPPIKSKRKSKILFFKNFKDKR